MLATFYSILLSGCLSNSKPPIDVVIAKWGGTSSSYDDHVADVVLTSVDGVHSYDMDSEMLNALVHKLQSEPRLLKRLFIRYRGGPKDAPSCDDKDWFIARLIERMQTNSTTSSRKALYIVLLASMFDKPEWVSDLEWKNVEAKWNEIASQVEQWRYFVVYDHAYDKYAVDEAALSSGHRVLPSRQTWLVCE